MTQKVVILTAGSGSRLNERTKFFNKALLKVGNQAAISHIIDLFPAETDFVVAVGHLGNLVKQYLSLAHPECRITYVEIDKYSVPGSGPAYALEKCKQHLQEPFFFVACDTLIRPSDFLTKHRKDVDYVAYDHIKPADAGRFCTLQVHNGRVIDLLDKLPTGTEKAFTGFAHIHSWRVFWDAMQKNKQCIYQELQLSPALAKLPELHALQMTWFDVGSEQGLLNARAAYPGIDNLDKADEELYVVKNKVIKYFFNSDIVRKRIERTKVLGDLVPALIADTQNYYQYNFVYGQDLFERSDIVDLMPKLLTWAQDKLWTNKMPPDDFYQSFGNFYRDKTLKRVKQFHDKTSIEDQQEAINGLASEKVSHYLDHKIEWHWLLMTSKFSGFHGDFQPGNIVVDFSKNFKLIDWRQDFGGYIDVGDRYYDFAKLYCSLLMPHPSIKNGKYSLRRSGGEVFVDIEVPKTIRDCRDIFESWLAENGYSLGRTSLLAAIVMLNMAPLHEHPLDQWLYYYSKNLLSQIYPTESR